MLELFGWLLLMPLMWWGNASVGVERSEVVFETTPGMEAQVSAALRTRIVAAGLDLEEIQPGQGGRVVARVRLGMFQDEVIGALTRRGVFGLHHVLTSPGAACPASLPAGQTCLADQMEAQRVLIVEAQPLLDGTALEQVEPAFDYNGLPTINFRLTAEGARTFCAWTSEQTGDVMAIVVDDEVLTAPRIQSPICGGQGQITGNFTVEETRGLAASLQTPPLRAPVALVERTPLPPPARKRVRARDFPGPPRKL